MFPPGTEVNVCFNFMMTSPTVRTVATFFDIAQFHNNDTALGGSTSPPFEIDLQPNDQMNIAIGYLTANGPSNSTFIFSKTVNGVGISYGYVFQDSVNIVRNHNYAMRIQCKMHPTAGFLNVWRDGVQIVNYSGPLGFNFNTYWAFGVYRASGPEAQIAKFQNMIVTAGPYSLGTASTYMPIAADVGTALTLTVTATNAFGSASATSAATGVVR
jgi:hypothetical protein